MILLSLLFAVLTHAQDLKLVSPARSPLRNPVRVEFSLREDILRATFTVKAKTLNTKPVLGPGEYPFQYDVVEVFVSAQGGNPYYEFNLSPLGQTFQVKIDNKVFTNNVEMGLRVSTHPTENGWIGIMEIPLRNLGWGGNPDLVVGNAFAIQGKNPRSYWSLWLPPASRPRFHQPEYFRPLL